MAILIRFAPARARDAEMRAQRPGRILVTGSIARLMPGTDQAVYNATKAFLLRTSGRSRASAVFVGSTTNGFSRFVGCVGNKPFILVSNF
jgi:NAD(P)-dependent dehydrogenase (short-subunit alcohol dehydrogenase family)